jgi:signal transduction histidine kinase/CheY-like chemotaxis protein
MAGGLPERFSSGERAILEAIATGAALGDVLDRVVRLVEAQATGMMCSILLLDEQKGCVHHGAAPSLPSAFVQAIDGAPIGPAAGSCGTAAWRGETVVVEDIATDPLWASYREVALPHDLRACWSTPIFSADRRVLGTFAMYYRERRAPSAAEREWVDAAAHLAAVAIGHQQAERERTRLETQLHQAQRIQSLGTLAGGIAHDFANVVAAMLGNAELASVALPGNHRAQRNLANITQAGQRAADLIRRILTFSRRQEPQRRLVRLQHLVEDALRLLRATLPPVVEIDTSFDPTAPGILADATQIYQVVMNLGTNAAHAMGPRGGRLSLRVEMDVPPDLDDGAYVLLSVSDTGCGMDASTIERIFEPFFTTKPIGEGTGLGLSVVHGIVKSHDGAIAVDSAPGAGTTFRLYFPVADADVVAAAARAEPADVRGHGERVLYVDDEEALVDTTTRILERLGYRVTAFSDPRRALDAFNAGPNDFDAVVTDLAMPGLSGLELAREIRRVRSDIPLLFTSGFVRAEDVPELLELAPSQLLVKPNTVVELGPALSALLAARPRPARV